MPGRTRVENFAAVQRLQEEYRSVSSATGADSEQSKAVLRQYREAAHRYAVSLADDIEEAVLDEISGHT